MFKLAFGKIKSLLVKSLGAIINACDSSSLAKKDIVKRNVFVNSLSILRNIEFFSLQPECFFDIQKTQWDQELLVKLSVYLVKLTSNFDISKIEIDYFNPFIVEVCQKIFDLRDHDD